VVLCRIYPITFGTLKNPSSLSGAFLSAFSLLIDGFSSSSLKILFPPIG